MRQTDSLSFAYQYYNYGFDFFNPKLYNLKNIDGKAACEFPITYYISSFFYLIFGKHPSILKLIHLIICYIGVYHVFKLSNLILEEKFISLLISFFLLTSTVFNYYSLNYLPDIPALGFTLIGVFYVFNFLNDHYYHYLFIGFLFLLIGSLIKVTFSLYILAILIFSLFSYILRQRFKFICTKNSVRIIVYCIASLLLVALWNAYMLYYNFNNLSFSFNLKPTPIWDLNTEQIKEVLSIITNFWNSEYFSHLSMIVILVCFLIQLIFIKKSNFSLSVVSVISLLGCGLYFILFFSQFKDHDYYILVFFPLISFILINAANVILKFLKTFNKSFKNIGVILFVLVIIYGIRYSGLQLNRRFSLQLESINKTSFLIEKNIIEIKNLSLPKDCKVIVAPDPSQNGGLLFLDKEGWTIDRIQNVYPDTISKLKTKGANYLILNDQNQIINSKDFGTTVYNEEGIKIIEL